MPSIQDELKAAEDAARATERRGAWDEALGEWDACRIRFPTALSGWAGRAKAFVKLMRLEEAAKTYVEIAERWPNRSIGLEGLARVAELRDGWSAALEAWAKCHDRFPEALSVRQGRAKALLKNAQWETAGEAYAAIAERWPDRPFGQEGLGRVAELQGRWLDAAHFYEQANGIAASVGLENRIIKCLVRAERPEAAAKRADHASRAYPSHPYAWSIRLRSAWARRRPDVLSALEREIDEAPLSPEARFEITCERMLLRQDYRALEAEARAFRRTHPLVRSPYLMGIQAARRSHRPHDLLRWANWLRRSGLDPVLALNTATSALIALHRYRACRALIRHAHRHGNLPGWSHLFRFYVAQTSVGSRIRSDKLERHIVRLGRAILRAWPDDAQTLQALIPFAAGSPSLQAFVLDHGARHHPNAKAFGFRARSHWLTKQATTEVSDTREQWEELRRGIDTGDPSGGLDLDARDVLRAFFATGDKMSTDAFVDAHLGASRHDPSPRVAKLASEAFLAYALWWRDGAAADRAFACAVAEFESLARDRGRTDRQDRALDLFRFLSNASEILFFEARKPDLEPESGAAISPSHFLSCALWTRFARLASPQAPLLSPDRSRRVQAILRWLVATAVNHARTSSNFSELRGCTKIGLSLVAYADWPLARTILHRLSRISEAAHDAVGRADLSEFRNILDIIHSCTILRNFRDIDLRGSRGESKPAFAVFDRLIARQNEGAPPEKLPFDLRILWGALRCQIGEDALLLSCRDEAARRPSAVQELHEPGVIDFRRCRSLLDGAPPRVATEFGRAGPIDAGACASRPVCTIVVSCDPSYLLKYGWCFLATLSAMPGRTGLRVCLHVVNPTALARQYVAHWKTTFSNLVIEAVEDRARACGAPYYAMLRYKVVHGLIVKYDCPALILDIDFWFPRIGVGSLIERLDGTDLAVYDHPENGIENAMPWRSVLSGAVYLGNTTNGRRIAEDMSRGAETIGRAFGSKWFIDQNFFFDQLPTWKAMCSPGAYVNLKTIGTYSGVYIVPDSISVISDHARSSFAHTVACARLQDRLAAAG